uniref:Uncharacterized protein n=1 Tax=Aegilops tauschii subsp. strangulata TaxID=200361 RepID=A0A453RKM4_AEGTS
MSKGILKTIQTMLPVYSYLSFRSSATSGSRGSRAQLHAGPSWRSQSCNSHTSDTSSTSTSHALQKEKTKPMMLSRKKEKCSISDVQTSDLKCAILLHYLTVCVLPWLSSLPLCRTLLQLGWN